MRSPLPIVCVALAACFFAQALPSVNSNPTVKTTKPQPMAAEWSKAVADALTDPHFYDHFPLGMANSRFATLVPTPIIDRQYGTLEGRNLKMGILFVKANLEIENSDCWLQEANFFLPIKDPQGQAVYPLLKSLLESRLKKPLWNHRTDGNWLYWRKGKSKYVISLEQHEYITNGQFPETGPFVIAGAGEEQGDSEDP